MWIIKQKTWADRQEPAWSHVHRALFTVARALTNVNLNPILKHCVSISLPAAFVEAAGNRTDQHRPWWHTHQWKYRSQAAQDEQVLQWFTTVAWSCKYCKLPTKYSIPGCTVFVKRFIVTTTISTFSLASISRIGEENRHKCCSVVTNTNCLH